MKPLAPSGTKNDNLTGFGMKLLLPLGTEKIIKKNYEEIIIPYQKPTPFQENERLISIEEIDEFAKSIFKGYKTLNRLQSRLFEIAYNSNENILVCAPTGAGKTDVAVMTILHEIKQHFQNNLLIEKNFKIIYVAPMKALASEITGKLNSKFLPLGIICKELTGDTQLTKKELEETQIIITTPEKWDVITRKSGDMALTSLVKLLIIDEVHLLHEERGPVIEVLVARTLRQVETSQSMIRIVGLSATLPNYQDISTFLKVNSDIGLFYFDNSFRPVPLTQKFIGVKENNQSKLKQEMNEISYEKVLDSILNGHQVMIFVHSRKDTVQTAQKILEIATLKGTEDYFLTNNSNSNNNNILLKEISKSKNKELKDLFPYGFGIHHAGMLRSDRRLVERCFLEGSIKVLCCTATLAWGVNLPAHTVIIKGTQLYDPKKGNYVELGMLDVMQIFGRAGRPQFDSSGEGIIITTYDKVYYYLQLLNHQLPIESQFINSLTDHLNAEIVLGTVTNINEAIDWLSYTYLYVRMLKNPLIYGLTWQEKIHDPFFIQKRKELIVKSAQELDNCKMIRFNEKTGIFDATDLGRVSSHFYIEHGTILKFNESLHEKMLEDEILTMIAQANEFENIMLREEEMEELEKLKEYCFISIKGGPENKYGKVIILLQAYLSYANIDSFTLISDSAYIIQNITRLLRGLFEIVLKKSWASMSERVLNLCKMIERRIWYSDKFKQHPLRQFPYISKEILYKLESKNADLEKLLDMNSNEIGQLINHPKLGITIQKYIRQFPSLDIQVNVQPITRNVLKIQLEITANFEWNDKIHTSVEPWWIWIEDSENEIIYHIEYFLLYKKQKDEIQKLVFTIPIFEPLPPQYYVHAISDRWLGAENIIPVSFKHLILPHQYPPYTELLDLTPLPIQTLHSKEFESLYNFSHFNPIQTQVFHIMYHTNYNVLLGAPTGSGKTIAAELAILKLFRDYPHLKVVYIGPLKALVRERLNDWTEKFGKKLKKKIVELTGEYTPNIKSLKLADIVLTTPEKWDGISRNWQHRSYVKMVGLIIIDEIHLLGDERGPILEVIVSRMRYIASETENIIRIIGLSTALANAKDLADWLGIQKVGLFNFRPSVRPVPLEAHIQGYPGKHYCPRMATMNKPTYKAIVTYSPEKPVIIFVSSRRQTRLTALDLISYYVNDENSKKWLHMSENELNKILKKIKDTNLKHCLPFGIGLHHAGLTEEDRKIVENLFSRVKIQILISTSTLAWGVNLPAHLVIIKGTEYYDAKTKRYVDFPITDVLQMMGRAGRPQFDNQGIAVIMVHEPKKNFYKKFLYEPFPVESNLLNVLHDHLNAEICSETITTKQDAIEYLTWTYFFRRLLINPSYYELKDKSLESINHFLSEKIENTLKDLEKSQCIFIEEDNIHLYPLTMGKIISFYYLHYKTAQLFNDMITNNNDIPSLLTILTKTYEYEELPVRHNEDKINEQLANEVPWAVDSRTFDSPHTKAHLLLQAHFSRLPLPISDYITDTKTVLDQSIRIIQAMIDVSADKGWLFTSINCMHLIQMINQGLWFTDSTLLQFPYFNEEMIEFFQNQGIECLPEFLSLKIEKIGELLKEKLSFKQVNEIIHICEILPSINIQFSLPEIIEPEKEIFLKIELYRCNSKKSSFAYTPHFPKKKEEGWWLIIGDPETKELIALRRIILSYKITYSTLSFQSPQQPGNYSYYLYLISDSYLGLDQQYEIKFKII